MTKRDVGLVSVRALGAILVLLLVSGSVFLYFFGEVVSPGEVGIRQIAFGPYRGFSERVLRPGYHWVVPFYSRIYHIPQTVQVFDFHRDPKRPDASPLEVPTSDRAIVDLDVSVLVRFQASNRLLELGVDPAAWDKVIRTSAGNALRRSLSVLETAQFYDPERREARLNEARELMKSELEPKGIEVQAVLLRRYTYGASLEDSIFMKNLEELKRELSIREAEYARAEGEVENVKSNLNSRMSATKEQGEWQAASVRAKGDLYETQKRAEADLGVASARAEVDAKRAQVLADARTASVYVAREMAPILGSLKGGVVSGIDPYDVQAWVSRLGVKEEK